MVTKSEPLLIKIAIKIKNVFIGLMKFRKHENISYLIGDAKPFTAKSKNQCSVRYNSTYITSFFHGPIARKKAPTDTSKFCTGLK